MSILVKKGPQNCKLVILPSFEKSEFQFSESLKMAKFANFA